jgi:hypothetical protein
MKTFLMTLLCLILTATIFSTQAAPKCPEINQPISSSFQVVNVTEHFTAIDLQLSSPACIVARYQDQNLLGPLLRVESLATNHHYLELHRMFADTTYDIKIYAQTLDGLILLHTVTVRTLDDPPIIKAFDGTVTLGESLYVDQVKIFPWPIQFGTSRPPFLIGIDNRGRIVMVIDIFSGQPFFTGFGFDQNPFTHQFAVNSTQSIDLWNANGTKAQSASTCSIHNEASWNRFPVGTNAPFSLVTALSHNVGAFPVPLLASKVNFRGYSQVEDGLAIWDVRNNIVEAKGYLHTTYGVPYELRDAHSDLSDTDSQPCCWAIYATDPKQDWSHGTSLQYGEKFLIYNASHMQSTILLFDHAASKILYYVGGDLSDFTFESEDAKWSGAHDVQQSYSTPSKLGLLMFDDRLPNPAVPNPFSRGLEIELDFQHMTIRKVNEWRFKYDGMHECFAPILGGIERRGSRTIVTFPLCEGDGDPNGSFGYVVEYQPSGAIAAVTRLNIDNPQPLPADGIYRSRIIDSINGETVEPRSKKGF